MPAFKEIVEVKKMIDDGVAPVGIGVDALTGNEVVLDVSV
jgi:hypothetical protein